MIVPGGDTAAGRLLAAANETEVIYIGLRKPKNPAARESDTLILARGRFQGGGQGLPWVSVV